MIDLTDILAEKLVAAGFTDAGVKRLADADKGGIAVRRLPSTTTARYMDGTRQIQYLVQVVVVRESEAKAIEDCEKIADLVPLMDLKSRNGSYLLTSVDVYTEPQETRPPEKGPYAWDVKFQALITTTKGRI